MQKLWGGIRVLAAYTGILLAELAYSRKCKIRELIFGLAMHNIHIFVTMRIIQKYKNR